MYSNKTKIMTNTQLVDKIKTLNQKSKFIDKKLLRVFFQQMLPSFIVLWLIGNCFKLVLDIFE